MEGMQIRKRRRQVSAEVVARFNELPVANISDCMARMTPGGARLRPMHKRGRLGRPALTVKTRPGDNLFIHKAMDLAVPGDVIVVDGGGDLTNALIGEIMVTYARTRGIAGFVMYGAIRDLDMISEGDFPVYAAGVTHRGPYKDGPGAINVTIAIDGMVIEPGDLIVGDADGILCVPYDAVDAVGRAAADKGTAEARSMANIAAGTHDTRWVDSSLKRIGCNTEPE